MNSCDDGSFDPSTRARRYNIAGYMVILLDLILKLRLLMHRLLVPQF
jgi:hypothetical protein